MLIQEAPYKRKRKRSGKHLSGKTVRQKTGINYSTFGSLMPGRTYTIYHDSSYNYGYQGSLKDNDIYGNGNAYTTKNRELSELTDNWWSPDPVFHPDQSPYITMDDNPILNNDVNGDDIDAKKSPKAPRASQSPKDLKTNFGIKSDFYDAKGNFLGHVEDGSNAVYKQVGSGHDLHYELLGFDQEQGGENKANLETAIMEQQNLNSGNTKLQENADGQGETHCNQATQNILKTVGSVLGTNNIDASGSANAMIKTLSGSDMFKETLSYSEAAQNAQDGGLSIVGYVNPTGGHGHIATFSVGANIDKGAIANIGPSAYSGFVPLNNAISKKKDKVYFILSPTVKQ